jgi:hypothetical protein
MSNSRTPGRVSRLLLLMLACWWTTATAQAQVPPAAVSQFQQTIGNRVEAVTILGGDYGAAGGIYTFRGGTLANVNVTKVGGGGNIAPVRPLGDTGLRWAPVVLGNLGFISARNTFRSGYLQGNEMTYDTLAAQLGGGSRVYVTERFSVATTVSAIYGHVENRFHPHNAVGDAVEPAADGTYVNWRLDTWSVAPSLELLYDWTWRRVRLQLTSHYTFFHTESFRSTSVQIDVEGDSHTWDNKVDADVPLGVKLFGRELHTGGFFGRTDLFGGISDGLNENHVYSVNGRLVLDYLHALWKVRWIGLGASWFWGDHVSGWTAGLDVQFQF